jgi:uncharacterized protein
MRFLSTTAAILCLAGAASADVETAVNDHLLPGFDAFATAAEGMRDAAEADCRAGALRPAYDAAFDAWMEVADLHIGPSETGGLSIAFWPDDRGFTSRTLRRLVDEADASVLEPAAFAELSIAARGFFALDMLLADPAFADYETGSYTCALVQATSADLAAQAEALAAGWHDFAPTLTEAGSADNATYLSEAEATRALYTQLLAALEFTDDTRLGRPLGTFDRPRPTRAEGWRSGRPARNVALSVSSALELARAIAPGPIPRTEAAAARVQTAAEALPDPTFQDITDPQSRIRVESMQQAVEDMREAAAVEIGTALGITAGFNSQDGD